MRRKKKFGPFLDLCVSSLRRGHANLLCIVPILSDVSEGTSCLLRVVYKCCHFTVSLRCGTRALTPSKVKTGAMARPKLTHPPSHPCGLSLESSEFTTNAFLFFK